MLITVRAFTIHLAGTANGFRLNTCFFLGWFLVMTAKLHLAENAFTLHLLLENLQRLLNVVIAYTYTNHVNQPLSKVWSFHRLLWSSLLVVYVVFYVALLAPCPNQTLFAPVCVLLSRPMRKSTRFLSSCVENARKKCKLISQVYGFSRCFANLGLSRL